jgi:hypothetical protein
MWYCQNCQDLHSQTYWEDYPGLTRTIVLAGKDLEAIEMSIGRGFLTLSRKEKKHVE